MDFLQGAQGIASVARWFVGAALALAVVLVPADVAVGILAARHTRRGVGGRDA